MVSHLGWPVGVFGFCFFGLWHFETQTQTIAQTEIDTQTQRVSHMTHKDCFTYNWLSRVCLLVCNYNFVHLCTLGDMRCRDSPKNAHLGLQVHTCKKLVSLLDLCGTSSRGQWLIRSCRFETFYILSWSSVLLCCY